MARKVSVDHSELIRSVCLETFTDPRSLPCLHSFCFSCLENWWKNSATGRNISCPICKEKSGLSPRGIKDVKSNFFVADLVERLSKKVSAPADKDVVCYTDDCGQTAVQYCTEGCGRLCTDCLHHHGKSRGSRNHTVVDVDKSTTNDIISDVLYCKTHPRSVIDQYCVDCDLAACGTCLLRHHRQHKLVDIEEQAKISQKELQAVLQQTDVLIKLIDEQINDSEKHETQSTNDIKNIKQQIDQVINVRILKLNNQRKQLFASLHHIEQQKDKILMTVHSGEEFNKAAVASLQSYTYNMLRHGRDYAMVQQAGDIQSRLASITMSRFPTFTWSRLDNKAASLGDMTVARLSIKADVMDSEVLVKKCEVINTDVGGGSGFEESVCKIPLQDSGHDVGGMAVMGDTLWIAHNHGNWGSPLYAYGINTFHKYQKFSNPGLCYPNNMVMFPTGEQQLVISDYGFLLWLKVNRSNGVWRVMSKRTVTFKHDTDLPRGLCVHDNQLLVCVSYDNHYEIHILSTSGEEIRKVTLLENVWPEKVLPRLTAPGFVAMEYFNKHVVLVTEKGDIQQTYKGEEGFVPQDIVSDGHSIYVADWYNHSVDELSHDGRHVRQLISGKQGLRLPKRICVDGTGNLYVAQGERATQQHVWILQKRKTPGHKLTVPSLHTKAGKSPMAPRPRDSASKLQTALSQNAKVGVRNQNKA